MGALLSDIENIPGFVDWFEGRRASRGEPSTFVELHGVGCTFSRAITEEERATILGFLHDHAEKHTRYYLQGILSAPFAEISGERIDAFRTAVRDIELAAGCRDSHSLLCMECKVILTFGARRDAAEKKREEHVRRIFWMEIEDCDGQSRLIGDLVSSNWYEETAVEIQRDLEGARKEIGDVELDAPPIFRALLRWGFDARAVALDMRARLEALGLATKFSQEVSSSAQGEVHRWRKRRLVKAGRIEELMRPGALSEAGFLGETERLQDVLKEDAKTLSSLGITAAEVADRLRPIVEEGIRRYWESMEDGKSYLIDTFRVKIKQWRGTQECPWICDVDHRWSSIDFEIENRRTGAILAGPGLIVHLIAEHGFFEGKGTRYRVDPRHAAEVLGLQVRGGPQPSPTSVKLSMIASPSDIEEIPGFIEWFVGKPSTPRGEPSTIVELHGMGCAFSRSLAVEERVAILDFLRQHSDEHHRHALCGVLSVPLDEISEVRVDDLRMAVRRIERTGGFDDSPQRMSFEVVLSFGARRDAAEKMRAELELGQLRARIMDGDGECRVNVYLPIPLRWYDGTAAEFLRLIEVARTAIGDVDPDAPPRFYAELTWKFQNRVAFMVARAVLDGLGLTTQVVEGVDDSARPEVVLWQRRRMAKAGRGTNGPRST